jgi:hypothetical protein
MTDTVTTHSQDRDAATLHIDFLYWEDCPSHEAALELLRSVLADEHVAAALSILDVETDADAEALRFPGSPTIRVNGQDIDPTVDDDVVGLTCRAYRTPAGKISPLPPRELIVNAIRGSVR